MMDAVSRRASGSRLQTRSKDYTLVTGLAGDHVSVALWLARPKDGETPGR